MALQPSITATTLQVGASAYLMKNNVPVVLTVVETISDVTDNDANDTNEQVNSYLLSDGILYPSSKVYASKNAFKTAVDSAIDALT